MRALKQRRDSQTGDAAVVLLPKHQNHPGAVPVGFPDLSLLDSDFLSLG